MSDIVAAINAAKPEMAGKITFEPTEVANPATVDESALIGAIGATNWRPLNEGVRQTVEHLGAAAQAGKVDVERILA
jgi:hypothetical protein